MTFVARLRRDVLSAPFALNKFIRASNNNSARLWPSARAEVDAFVGLLPAIASSWTRDLIDLDENEDETTETMLIPTDDFLEVPLEVVEASGWVEVAAGRWRYGDETIIVLESRALTRGVEILASAQQLYRKRCVALVGNMAAALSFERRR